MIFYSNVSLQHLKRKYTTNKNLVGDWHDRGNSQILEYFFDIPNYYITAKSLKRAKTLQK